MMIWKNNFRGVGFHGVSSCVKQSHNGIEKTQHHRFMFTLPEKMSFTPKIFQSSFFSWYVILRECVLRVIMFVRVLILKSFTFHCLGYIGSSRVMISPPQTKDLS